MSRAAAGAAAGVAVMGLFSSALSTGNRPASLDYIFQRIRLNLVPLNAQDIYQICTVVYSNDTLGVLSDAELMRGIADAFQRSDQRVLNPFQASLVMDTLRRAGINASPKEVMLPEEEAISPETLLNVLRAMNVHGGTRDERKIDEVLKNIPAVLDEFSPTQLSLALCELAKLRCVNAEAMNRIAKRLFEKTDDLSVMEVSLTTFALAKTRGMPYATVRRAFALSEQRLEEFQPDDYVNVLLALQVAGKQYGRTFVKLVEAALGKVENLDAVTLTEFLVTFTTLDYGKREHLEIFADALVDVASDLDQQHLVQSLVALQRLDLLDEELFSALASCVMRYAKNLEPRLIAPVMDICSGVSHNTDGLMHVLLDRALECTRMLHPNDLADILDIVALYPGARGHALVEVFGRQARLRLELFNPVALARATRGLAHLGYRDVDYYTQAADTGFRFGFKDWSSLEPILMGMCFNEEVPVRTVKVLASFVSQMAKSMSLQEVERANRYLVQLKCEENHVYRSLANRVMHFVKEITPDMPQELQVLVQRGAVNRLSEG
ncbi:conserved hypothetical protein [Leishmania mexicana MHOM/GT/2001/U1103]|uniref:RNA-editing substrate-binding complex 8 protein HEAT repeats domain-containing protein n=1 Tax=Leishmania mexicana (strain MHOM/GT/2001/U1103) TaxID=929439 RepID=E9ATR1_LEIMU|nr:conserved hypothetical protein [Leishmania mexicana MHOM/GT/2001/U1103]CBZ26336.1 conserved hypothetical protein [Leishmania mexicana MHOM/GT/2001/U1103]